MIDEITTERMKELASERDDLKSRLAAAEHERDEVRAINRADDERLLAAGQRVGLWFGCDTPEHLADEIESLRQQLTDFKARVLRHLSKVMNLTPCSPAERAQDELRDLLRDCQPEGK